MAKEYRQREEWKKLIYSVIVTDEKCNVALYSDLHYKKDPWDSESFRSENNMLTIRGDRL